MSYIIGLTGGIGCGKSLVSDYLQKKGHIVIDADKIARQIMAHGQAGLEAVRKNFGEGMIATDGTLDRAKLGELVFSDSQARQKLDDLTHPIILQNIREQVAAHDREAIVIVDVPLLLESGGYTDWIDEVWVVSATVEQQIARIMARDGLTKEQAQARVDAQWSTARKVALADEVIDNSQSIAKTYAQIERLLQKKQAEIITKRF